VTYPQVIHRIFTVLYTVYTEVIYTVIHRDPMTETIIIEAFKGSKRTLSQRVVVTEGGTENTIKNGS
jgi:hypothetical protein